MVTVVLDQVRSNLEGLVPVSAGSGRAGERAGAKS
jgi:hypothetical protein